MRPGLFPRPIVVLATFGVPLALLAAALFLQVWRDLPLRHLLSDPAEWAVLPIYAGALSYVGVLGWAATGAIALFTAAALSGREDRREIRHLLVWAGFLSLWLCIDDLYTVHELILPRLGVSKTIGLAASGAFGLAYLAWNRDTLRQQRWGMLVLAMGAFAISLVVDEIYGVKDDRSLWRLAEDGSKLVGISLWLSFHVDTALRALRKSREPR
ncbi:MAG: hypothetical protein M3395_06155 [Chloroflexota bacterium]|nr:hypothetical protein [Chloroflexota bacterium]